MQKNEEAIKDYFFFIKVEDLFHTLVLLSMPLLLQGNILSHLKQQVF